MKFTLIQMVLSHIYFYIFKYILMETGQAWIGWSLTITAQFKFNYLISLAIYVPLVVLLIVRGRSLHFQLSSSFIQYFVNSHFRGCWNWSLFTRGYRRYVWSIFDTGSELSVIGLEYLGLNLLWLYNDIRFPYVNYLEIGKSDDILSHIYI